MWMSLDKKNKKSMNKSYFFQALPVARFKEHKCPLPRYVTSHTSSDNVYLVYEHTHTHALNTNKKILVSTTHKRERRVCMCVYVFKGAERRSSLHVVQRWAEKKSAMDGRTPFEGRDKRNRMSFHHVLCYENVANCAHVT